MDEVGRGSWAGPVVAAAVLFEKNYCIRDLALPVLIDDSKKLTAKQRNEASEWILENALLVGIGKGSVRKINTRGIVPATNSAFRKAFKLVKNSEIKEFLLFIDAFYIPRLPGVKKENQTPLIKGDSIEFTIAAASIVAKVYRDALMAKLGTSFPEYQWPHNKGYGTKAHQEALKKFGPTKHHRTLFIQKCISRSASSQA